MGEAGQGDGDELGSSPSKWRALGERFLNVMITLQEQKNKAVGKAEIVTWEDWAVLLNGYDITGQGGPPTQANVKLFPTKKLPIGAILSKTWLRSQRYDSTPLKSRPPAVEDRSRALKEDFSKGDRKDSLQDGHS